MNAIASARKNIDENLGQLDRLLSTPKSKEIFNAIQSARDKYRAGQEEFIRLVADGKKPEATSDGAGAGSNATHGHGSRHATAALASVATNGNSSSRSDHSPPTRMRA
ncbi:MCP four helix bundle domain-containing protein [Herminiimonas sp. CN]|uniref:MCP four helix bundle domain-containing protein n=1 Tax=Herminiimonas sp. CN TaxID=1349818 RepID=UPI00054EBF81